MDEKTHLIAEIQQLKEQLNAVVLAHVYQDASIQSLADFTGDSLALSKTAVSTDADIIVFCGVSFMAETAHILNPEKTVLLPAYEAGCDLADMATLAQLLQKKKEYPHAKVVGYVNSSAEIKAASDCCCTSANAVNVVEYIDADEILFLPDKNLGSYIAEQTDKTIHLWDGYCYVHEHINPKTVRTLQTTHLSAETIAHPECNKTIRDLADVIGSTSKMAQYVQESSTKEFIICTEDNFIHHLQSRNPEKTYYPVHTTCQGMRHITLPQLYQCLKEQKHVITLPEDIRKNAKKALDNMMKVS